MKSLGICVQVKAGKATVTCVLVEGSRSDPRCSDGFDLKTDAIRVPGQLKDLAWALSSKLGGMQVDTAVIRLADVAPTGSRKAGPRTRLLIEGALAFVCETKELNEVHLRTGKEIGESLDTSKELSEQAGKQLDSKRPEAGAAALSGLPDG